MINNITLIYSLFKQYSLLKSYLTKLRFDLFCPECWSETSILFFTKDNNILTTQILYYLILYYTNVLINSK